MSKTVTHLSNMNINDEWETPRNIFEQACIDYNILPELDVAATKDTAKCSNFFTMDNDALSQSWMVDFFMNPPYSRVSEFIEYAVNQSTKYNVNGIILVYAKTDTIWWHKYVEGKLEHHFVKGRISFLQNGVKPRHCKNCKKRFYEEITNCNVCNRKLDVNSATYPSVWIILRGKK